MTLPRAAQLNIEVLTHTEGDAAYSPKDNFAGPTAPVDPQDG